MSIKLFYITNNPDVALIAEKYGVDRIWIDLEKIGKEKRQKGINSIKSNHHISDISRIKPLLTSSEILVRVNPWNENSENEINSVIEAGADMIMLPMWKTAEEVKAFLDVVNHRVKVTLLLETGEAVECADEVLKLDFDEIHIGLNDLHLSYGLSFLFECLTNGTVERLCKKFKDKGIPYGFGGVARLGCGLLPAEMVLMEHARLGSTRAILSRSFCDVDRCSDLAEVEKRFKENLKPLRDYELVCSRAGYEEKMKNKEAVERVVDQIVGEIKGHGEI